MKKISCLEDLRCYVQREDVYLEPGGTVYLAQGVTVGTGVAFSGLCVVGKNSTIGPYSILKNVKIGHSSKVRAFSLMEALAAGDRNIFGPYCFLRDGCRVGDRCILGAYVEAARSEFRDGVKISHHAFVGDTCIGRNSILGAGTVVCNYDGRQHHKSRIGSSVLVGSGSMLVAPVSIGSKAVVGAGSVITRRVKPGTKVIQKRTSF